MAFSVLKSLQIIVAVLVGFAALVLACAEGGPIAAITLPICVFTLLLVDQTPRVVVPIWALTMAGLLAFVAAITEFATGGIESRILAGGHLLTYLTWVFLLQRKSGREYWWLILLGTLQVAVASVLTSAGWFGLSLVIFALLFTGTLTLLLLHRNTLAAESGEAIIERSRDIIRQTRTAQKSRGRVRAGVSQDLYGGSLNARIVGSTLAITSLSMAMAGLIFLLTPRIWRVQLSLFGDLPIGAARALTGFTDEVRLGDVGEILESNDPAMEIRLRHPGGREMTEQEGWSFLGADPLFRGSVLEQYVAGHWGKAQRGRPEPIPNAPVENAHLLDVKLYPVGVHTLFSFGNTVGLSTPRKDSYIMAYWMAMEYRRRRSDDLDRVFQYTVSVLPGEEDTMHPPNLMQRFEEDWRFYAYYLGHMTEVGPELLPIRSLVQGLLQDARSPQAAAEKLLTYLRDNPEFSYSMSQSVVDPQVDPVVDFLLNRKAGHCEYYASALTLMLRIAGIPARVASGFKGATYDAKRNVFVVQQLHAHTWTEAYLGGRWRTLDATPPERNAVVEQLQSPPTLYQLWQRGFESTWNFGSRMSQSQQQDLVYRPIQETAQVTWEVTKGLLSGNAETVQQLWQFVKDPGRWFSLQGGVAAFLILTALSAVFWLAKQGVLIILRLRRSLAVSEFAGPKVHFYERFRTILEKQGLYQRETQTAREYMREATSRIDTPLSTVGLSSFPPELIDRFYDVRFGGRSLDPRDEQEIDRRLTELERVLAEERRDSRNSPT